MVSNINETENYLKPTLHVLILATTTLVKICTH